MHIVVLRLLIEVAVWSLPMDHAAAHGDGCAHDMVDELRLAGVAHGIDAALREGQVNGPCEVERRCGGIPEICTLLLQGLGI